ncbi:MAG: F0F1-type ATP synthase membrane subunit b/b' [Alphaproteobacteria bacterium]|jgi:F0F1-type ATP synthase membrane subunit b/b'
MTAAFWVGLSTFIFVLFVVIKSYRAIFSYFDNQQKDIQSKLFEAEDVFQKAHDLYESYREKMETLELEAEQILKEANKTYKAIIDNADVAVDKIVIKKKNELARHVEACKHQLKQQILFKYADLIANNLKLSSASSSNTLN